MTAIRRAPRALAVLAAVVTLSGVVSALAGPPAAAELADPQAAATLPSAGCGSTTVGPGEETVVIPSGGVDRQYIRHVPPAHDGTVAVPLVVSFHGLGEGSVLHTRMTEYGPLADAEGFVVVFPQGLGSPVRWNTSEGSADLAFFADLLDHLEATLCIDTNRVFVSGLSNGAFMTSAVACAYADRIAAVVPVAGIRDPSWCDPARPVPVLTFHGTDDTWVSYEPVPGIVDAWAARNGCHGAPSQTFVGSDDVAEVTRIEHRCPEGVDVVFYSIEGGGHAWPGSEFSRLIEPAIGHTTFVISASELAWEFFTAHPMRRDIVSYTARYPAALGAPLTRIAIAGGFDTVAEVVRVGVEAFRTVAERGLATPGPQPPNEGPMWVTVVWPVEEAAAVEAAAAAWGADGDELHHAGGRLVLVIVYLHAIGAI